MAESGVEPTGSMGDDIPLAILSKRPPPALRLFSPAVRPGDQSAPGCHPGKIGHGPVHHHRTGAQPLCRNPPALPPAAAWLHPILTPADLAAIRASEHDDLKSADLSICWPLADGGKGLISALEALCRYAVRQVEAGARLLDPVRPGYSRTATLPYPPCWPPPPRTTVSLPAACAPDAALSLKPAKPGRSTTSAVCWATVPGRSYLGWPWPPSTGWPMKVGWAAAGPQKARTRYIGAVKKGILKVLSKMGISTLAKLPGEPRSSSAWAWTHR